MPEHFFWWLLTMACVVWYSTITIYVSVKGIADIRDMLSRLSLRQSDNRRNEEAIDRTRR
jgi:hypothetical protein